MCGVKGLEKKGKGGVGRYTIVALKQGRGEGYRSGRSVQG